MMKDLSWFFIIQIILRSNIRKPQGITTIKITFLKIFFDKSIKCGFSPEPVCENTFLFPFYSSKQVEDMPELAHVCRWHTYSHGGFGAICSQILQVGSSWIFLDLRNQCNNIVVPVPGPADWGRHG